MTGLVQAPTHGGADGTGPQDHEAHGLHSATCQALPVIPTGQARSAVSLGATVQRAGAIGSTMAGAPLRLVGGLAAPHAGTWRARSAAPSVSGRIHCRWPSTPPRPTSRRTAWPARAPGPRLHVDRRHERAVAPDAAPLGHGRGGRALGVPRRPARAPPSDGGLRGHDHVRHRGRGRGGDRPGAPGAPPRARHGARRAPVLGRATPSW